MSHSESPDEKKGALILVTGATGYVGGRLVPKLLEAGYRVRAVARSMEKLQCRPWTRHPNIELARADLTDLESLRSAAMGCHTAFYLVHSMMAAEKDFAEHDRQAARNMIAAAEAVGIARIIYLGGLGEEDNGLSEHLRSRAEVGRILRSGRTSVTWLRAAMILGSGSASFEMLRYLVDRMPVMFVPDWVFSKVQPIAIRNVLGYLTGCLENEETTGQILDIGGPEILSYVDLIRIYAEEAGLKPRRIVPVPFLTPKTSARLVHLITPVPSAIARPLAEGLKSTVIVSDHRIRSMVPQELLTCREAIRLALERIRRETVETCWMDAGQLLPPEWAYCNDATYGGGTIYEAAYRAVIEATVEEVWSHVARIGGRTGWYFGQGLWRLRGMLDQWAGGVALERGRRHPTDIGVGDALDFWRVIKVEENRRLLLQAEMKTPGEAILDFQLEPLGGNRVELKQISRFFPRGLWGISYWYALLPAHHLLFHGMLKSLAKTMGRPIVKGPERFRYAPTCAWKPRRDGDPED